MVFDAAGPEGLIGVVHRSEAVAAAALGDTAAPGDATAPGCEYRPHAVTRMALRVNTTASFFMTPV